MKRSLFVGVFLVAIVASMAVWVQAPAQTINPILGTWKQNMEKSVYNPGPPPPVGLGASASTRQALMDPSSR